MGTGTALAPARNLYTQTILLKLIYRNIYYNASTSPGRQVPPRLIRNFIADGRLATRLIRKPESRKSTHIPLPR